MQDTFELTPSEWIVIYGYPFVCKIIEAYLIPYAQNNAQDYNDTNNIRIIAYPDKLSMSASSSKSGQNQTFFKGDIIYVKIIEK